MPQQLQLNDQPGQLALPAPPSTPGINYVARYDDEGQATGRARIEPVDDSPPPRELDNVPTVEA